MHIRSDKKNMVIRFLVPRVFYFMDNSKKQSSGSITNKYFHTVVFILITKSSFQSIASVYKIAHIKLIISYIGIGSGEPRC